MSKLDIDDVLARLKQLFDISSDSALSRQLDTTPQTISSWRARQRVPYAVCIEIATQYGVSLDWLLLGKDVMSPLAQEPIPEAFAPPKDQKHDDDPEPSQQCQHVMKTFSRLPERDQRDVLNFIEEKLRIRDMEQRLFLLEHQVKGAQLVR